MIKQEIRALAASFLLLVNISAICNAASYSFDTRLTEVLFTYRVGFISQSARFTELSGSCELDNPVPARNSLNATIKTSSLRADQFEEKLKGSDFFNVTVWPEIRFKSRSMRPAGDNRTELVGDLTMNGITHQVTLSLVIHEAKGGRQQGGGKPVSDTKANFSATTTIRRSAFNITALGFLVDDEIEIQINGALVPRANT